jgi:hypothetical protein
MYNNTVFTIKRAEFSIQKSYFQQKSNTKNKKMKFILVALALVSVCLAQSENDWNRFQSKYGKSYRSASEGANKRAVWEANWSKINQHNEEFAKGQQTYTLGENEFADMTFEEFSQERLGLSPSVLRELEENQDLHEISGLRAALAVGACLNKLYSCIDYNFFKFQRFKRSRYCFKC